jgi:hypothetical protein
MLRGTTAKSRYVLLYFVSHRWQEAGFAKERSKTAGVIAIFFLRRAVCSQRLLLKCAYRSQRKLVPHVRRPLQRAAAPAIPDPHLGVPAQRRRRRRYFKLKDAASLPY